MLGQVEDELEIAGQSEILTGRGCTSYGNVQTVQKPDGTGTTTYDNLDRLTNIAYPNGDTVVYGYDAAGNRTSHTVNGVAKTNTFDNANRLTASGADTYTYDTNGNQAGTCGC